MALTSHETGPRTTAPTVGFVGLGHMGGAMADHLLAAGHPVVGTRRSRAQAEDLLARGLRWQDTPRGVAQVAAIVVTSVPDDDGLSAVASGPDGVLAGLGAGTTWLEMSTVSPTVSRELAAGARTRGATMLDVVGGDAGAYASVEPVLRTLGTPTRVGSNGQGLVLKLAINISLAVQMLALSEGLLLATRSGIDRALAVRIMANSAIGSPMLKARAPLVLDLPDDAWFSLGLMKKDLDLARDVARGLGVPLPTADRADDILGLARDLGYEGRNLAAFYRVLESTADGQAAA